MQYGFGHGLYLLPIFRLSKVNSVVVNMLILSAHSHVGINLALVPTVNAAVCLLQKL